MRNESPAQEAEATSPGVEHYRRKHPRVSFAGEVQLMLETTHGLASMRGFITNISIGGCALRVYASVEPYRPGRVKVRIDGSEVWLPIITRWVRRDVRGWSVGAAFDGLTQDKEALVARVVRQRLT